MSAHFQQTGPPPPPGAAPASPLPSHSASEIERTAFPDGRTLVISEINDTRFDGISLSSERRLDIQGLDCRCTIRRVLEACQCARCGAIVCKARHAVTCSFCGTQVCTSCTEIAEGPLGAMAVTCRGCVEASRPGRATRWARAVLSFFGM